MLVTHYGHRLSSLVAQYRIGISGWTYPGWRGVFYPKGLVHRRECEYAARCFNSIEINASFYLNNDAQCRAPFDAARLAQLVGIPPLHPSGTPLPEA